MIYLCSIEGWVVVLSGIKLKILDVLNIQTYSFIYHKLLYIIRVSNSTKMCGICFVLSAAPTKNHDLENKNFNSSQSYLCKNKIEINDKWS